MAATWPKAGGAQAQQKHARAWIGLKGVDDLLPILGLAGEGVRGDLPVATFLVDQVQHLHKLAEDQHLLALGHQGVEQFE